MSPQRTTSRGYLVAGGLLIAVLLGAVIYLPVRIAADAAARERAYHGVVSVDFCTYSGRSNSAADCFGTFRSDDGTLIVPDVTITFTGAHQDFIRRELEPATLTGPDDSVADADETAPSIRNVMWTLDAVLLAWLAAQVVWLVRNIRRYRASKPAR